MLSRTLASWGKFLGLSSNEPSAEEERRLHGRVPCDIETTCQPAGTEPGPALTVRVKNVSRGGIGLLSSCPFRVGELLSIHLPDVALGSIEDLLACVVRCDPTGAGEWFIGGTFSTSLSDEEIRRFEGSEEPTDPPDQRNWVRFPSVAQASYQIVQPTPSEQWTPSRVLNISGGGIALLITEPLPVGQLLSVELRRDSTVLVALASIIRSTVERDGSRIVGCNFIHELPEEQVARLLG